MTKEKTPNLNDIFGTKNKQEQAERALQLLNPVVSIVVTYDGRFGSVDVNPLGKITPSEARQILTRAIDAVSQKEAELIATQGAGKMPPPPPPDVRPDEGTVEPEP